MSFTTVTIQNIEALLLDLLQEYPKEKLILISHNNRVYAVSAEFCKVCEAIAGFVEIGVDQPIPIPFDTSDIRPLETIIYMVERHLLENPKQEVKEEEGVRIELKAWEKEVLQNYYPTDDISNIPYDDLINMLKYLGPLHTLIVVSIYLHGRYVKDKTVEEIRQTFKQPDDLTPEEKNAIKKENSLLTPIEV